MTKNSRKQAQQKNILSANLRTVVWTVFVFVCFFSVRVGKAEAATYWVSPTGTAAWIACVGSSPLNGTNACSLATANSNAIAGDTVFLREGTYLQTSSSGCGNDYVCGIFPKNRGTASFRIVYSAFNNEIPIITADTGTFSRGITILQGTGNGQGEGTYIQVTGITFHNLYNWVSLYNFASQNEIDHCKFYSDTGEDFGGAAGLTINSMCKGGGWTCYSKHNWIHHNTFSKVHQYGNEACHEGADMIRIGTGYPSSDNVNNASQEKDDYNTVENNLIEYAGHALMDTYGGYNVIRNNIMHNEGWITDYSGGTCIYPPMPNGKYGHRGLQISEDYGRPHQFVLVEGNRFGFTSANPNNPGEANHSISASSVIDRYNYSYGSHQSGIGTKWYRAFPDGLITVLTTDINNSVTTIPVASTEGLTNHYFYLSVDSERMTCTGKDFSNFLSCTRGYISTPVSHSAGATVYVNSMANRGQGGNGAYNVRIYNNTTYRNGHTYPYMQSSQTGCSTCPGKLAGINVYSLVNDVVVKNNIAYDNYSNIIYGYDITVDTGQNPVNFPYAITEMNNWKTSNGNPGFINPDMTDPTSEVLPNLALQSTSSAIDGGIYLTQTSGSGINSDTLIVDDAMYFQDGTWGSDLARDVTLFPDWIAVGAVDNIVQISNINYSANTITLASSISWNDNAPVWLYKKSDGMRVLYGNSTDYGAYEYTSSGDAVAPADPVGLVVY